MKNKLLKRIGILGLTTIAICFLIPTVNAADVCKTYKEYYLLNYKKNEEGAEEEDHYADYNYTDPKLSNATINNAASGRICLKNAAGTVVKNSSTEKCAETWTLDQFYDNYKAIYDNATKITNQQIDYSTTSGTTVTTYHLHGDATDATSGESGDRLIYYGISKTVLKGGSIFPETTTVTLTPSTNTIRVRVQRHITQANFNEVANSKIPSTKPDEAADGWGFWLAPAAYLIQYDSVCEEPSKYKATINYYYKGTTTKVEFKDTTKPNPYVESNLDDGDSAPVTSPDAKNSNCTPIESSVKYTIAGKNYTHDVFYECESYYAIIDYYYEGTTERVEFEDETDPNPYKKNNLTKDTKKYDVTSPKAKNKNCKPVKGQEKITVDMSDGNFHKVVYYECEEIEESPQTGSALIIVAWIIGLSSLGYAGYYLIKNRKEEK